MSLPDLKLIYKILQWHTPSDSVGVFAPLPPEIANQFPVDGKESEDTSPSHITLVYLGDLPQQFEEAVREIVNDVCVETKPFTVKLSKPKTFVNDKNQTIIHSPVVSGRLQKFHNNLKDRLLKNSIPVSNKFPEYKPHVTIEYVGEEEDSQYGDVKPEGDWIVDSVWIWGMSEPHMVLLGKK
jgi:2'-5' RNA ligase